MGNNIKQLLCFGDSNTWGLNGETGMRLPWEQRWTGLLQKKLGEDAYHVIEEGLCGRTTVFEDPLRERTAGNSIAADITGNPCTGGWNSPYAWNQ